MVYADYTYYKDAFGGTMAEVNFSRLSRKASIYLDRVTFGRINSKLSASIMTQVKDACCAVADTYLLNEQGGGIASESNDGISVSYLVGMGKVKTEEQHLRDAVSLYLGHTGLLYRGV